MTLTLHHDHFLLLVLVAILIPHFVYATETTNHNCDVDSSSSSSHSTDADCNINNKPDYQDLDVSDESIQKKKKKNEITCGLYLAPSTIPGAGLGLFVGDEKLPGDILGPGDVAVPLVDLSYHRGKPSYFSNFRSYSWDGNFFGMNAETDDPTDIFAHSPGLDSAINCHMGLINVGRAFPVYDIGNVTRSKSPGAGAFTPYYNGTTVVENRIPPGGELFKYYGKKYFETRDDVYGMIPFVDDYTKVEQLCQKWFAMDVKDDTVKDALWTIIKAMPWKPRTANALPSHPNLARQAATQGIRSLYQPGATRSLDELIRFGRCQDNIRHGPSTLPDAARGAFATRNLMAGNIIAGSPLLHIPHREYTFMYELNENENGEWARDTTVRSGTQLVINYCWGHVDSTILLCPYGTGVNFINHNQTQANVKVQWAPHGTMGHNDTWLKLSHKDMYTHKMSLAIDYVALRDIEEGEELFLDYGDAWEAAWTEHVRSWEPLEEWKDYKPAAEWNREMADEPILTVEEQMEDPYPDNIRVICHHSLKYSDYEERLESAGENLWHVYDKVKGVECDILERYWDEELDDFLYSVQFIAKNSKGKAFGTTRRWDLPRIAFLFDDVPYSSDIHLPHTFRYPAQLHEEMVSKTWRNDVGGAM